MKWTCLSIEIPFQDVVCLTKFQESEVLCLDKRSGSVVWSNTFATQQPWSVEVYDKDLQKKVPRTLHNQKKIDTKFLNMFVWEEKYQLVSKISFSDKCEQKGCGHFCANTPNGAKCLCKEGFELDTDGKSCTGKNYTFVYISVMS